MKMSNLANLDDQTRIRILKGLVLLGMGGTFLNLYFLKKTVDLMTDMAEKNKGTYRRMRLMHKIILRFAELADEKISHQIMEEFEFDWIVSDIDEEEEKP